MGRFVALVAVVAALGWSEKKKEGLPPAQEWAADTSGMVQMGSAPAGSPHGGGSPHGDLPKGHPAIPENSDQGMGMAGGGMPNLPPPDPNRKIDPSHHIKGVIAIHPKAADRAAPGGAVFVSVKKADSGGQPTGAPLAVQKLTWDKDQIPFEITEENAMIAGTELTGDVVVTARYDHDGDAISKQPGDVVGQLRVKIPADGVKLYLDTILP